MKVQYTVHEIKKYSNVYVDMRGQIHCKICNESF